MIGKLLEKTVGFQLGLDTGGTYTDAVLVDDNFVVLHSAKSLTTHRDLIQGLRGAVDQVLDNVEAQHIELVCLSTTLATNALVEGRGRKVALVLIGFTEQQVQRAGLADALASDPMVRVAGGHKASGLANQPLDMRAVRTFIETVDAQVDAYAVSAVFAVRNPEHEIEVQKLIKSLTAKPVTCGHHLSSGLDAPRRALTALLNARLIPMIGALLEAARLLLLEREIKAPLMVVKGDGSLISDSMARRYPVETILSGPAASVVGAQFLCGRDDLLISDMGGTTTDVAVIRNGKPKLNAEGATVGGWRTMVRAIDVNTYGLGGDSAVVYDREQRHLRLGPQRVMPLSLLAHQHPQCIDVLNAQLELPLSTTHSAQFVLAHSAPPTDLTFQQKELFEVVSAGPVAVQTLFKDQTLERALHRLVQRGIVLRAGFTPTDACHVLGTQTTWGATAARLGARLLLRYCNDNLGENYSTEEQLAESVCRRTSELTALALVDAVTAAEGLSVNAPQKELIERSLSVGGNALFSLIPRVHIPVLGLGAPASSYYPQAANLLGCELQHVDHAHVANALGAVVGSIRQEQLILISPAGGKRVSVLFPDGPVDFDDLQQGFEAAKVRAEELATEKAQLSGANEVVLELDRVDKIVKQGDDEIFFESRVTVTAIGRPAIP